FLFTPVRSNAIRITFCFPHGCWTMSVEAPNWLGGKAASRPISPSPLFIGCGNGVRAGSKKYWMAAGKSLLPKISASCSDEENVHARGDSPLDSNDAARQRRAFRRGRRQAKQNRRARLQRSDFEQRPHGPRRNRGHPRRLP